MSPFFLKEVGIVNHRLMWEVMCPICENTYVASATTIKNGKSTKCRKCANFISSKTHGKSKIRIYKIWNNIKQRCTNKNSNNYYNYGGRGIIICDEWRDNFMCFYDWSIKNGYSDELEIDRIDNYQGYSKNNCRWVTKSENAQNKRLKNYTGNLYGRLKIINENGTTRGKNNKLIRRFDCICDCGKIVNVRISSLISLNTQSCGCIKSEIITNRNKNVNLN